MQLLFKPTQVDTFKKKVERRSSSRVREHLANERTYLAWMRTAIAVIGFGVVMVRLRNLEPPILPAPGGNGLKVGLLFSGIGVLTVLLSTLHYLVVRRDIDEDIYEPADRWVILFSLAVMLLGAGVIYFVFSTPLNPLYSLAFE